MAELRSGYRLAPRTTTVLRGELAAGEGAVGGACDLEKDTVGRIAP
jgi:hypothetical protein